MRAAQLNRQAPLVTTLRIYVVLTLFSIALTAAGAWALLVFIGGDWSLARFIAWCAGVAPLSALLHRLFDLGRFGSQLSFHARQAGVGIVGFTLISIAIIFLGVGHFFAALGALGGTFITFSFLHIFAQAFPKLAPNMERTRDR